MSIAELTDILKKHECDMFRTLTGAGFSYVVREPNVIILHEDSPYKIYIKISEISSSITGVLPSLSDLRVRGFGRKASYIYGLIYDRRIVI